MTTTAQYNAALGQVKYFESLGTLTEGQQRELDHNKSIVEGYEKELLEIQKRREKKGR